MPSDSVDNEVVLPFPPRVMPTRHMRSTILLASIASLRQGGYFDRYVAALEVRHREPLLQAVAGTWIPLDTALGHYRACESLRLQPDTITELGRSTFDKTGGTLFGTVMRLAKGAGVTPWTVLPHLQRFWDRGYDGAGVRVLRLGPKEARMELAHCALADSIYFRCALRGVLQTVLQRFCQRIYVQDVSTAQRAGGTMSLRGQWA